MGRAEPQDAHTLDALLVANTYSDIPPSIAFDCGAIVDLLIHVIISF